MTYEEFKKLQYKAESKEENLLTEEELNKLKPYKVDNAIIMAAGTFTQGSTIELSCDGPLREPYIAYMQGGLTYEYGKYGILKAIQEMEKI